MTTIRTCRLCGEPRDGRKTYCSSCLADPQIYRACLRCGTVFNCAYVSQCRAILTRKYCGEACRRQASSDALSGKGLAPNAMCDECGKPFARGAQASKRYCSPSCSRRANKRAWKPERVLMACAWCDKPIMRSVRADCPRSFCGKACQMSYAVCVTRGKSFSEWKPPKPKLIESAPRLARFTAGYCRRCGDSFILDRQRHHSFAFYCSPQCGKADGRTRRRARKRDAYVADVWRPRIFKRDGYRCQICGKRLAMSKSVPHPKAPTIDHIIPLSEGGTHEPSNCQAAHFMCNAMKSGSAAAQGDQLLLIG